MVVHKIHKTGKKKPTRLQTQNTTQSHPKSFMANLKGVLIIVAINICKVPSDTHPPLFIFFANRTMMIPTTKSLLRQKTTRTHINRETNERRTQENNASFLSLWQVSWPTQRPFSCNCWETSPAPVKPEVNKILCLLFCYQNTTVAIWPDKWQIICLVFYPHKNVIASSSLSDGRSVPTLCLSAAHSHLPVLPWPTGCCSPRHLPKQLLVWPRPLLGGGTKATGRERGGKGEYVVLLYFLLPAIKQ